MPSFAVTPKTTLPMTLPTPELRRALAGGFDGQDDVLEAEHERGDGRAEDGSRMSYSSRMPLVPSLLMAAPAMRPARASTASAMPAHPGKRRALW